MSTGQSSGFRHTGLQDQRCVCDRRRFADRLHAGQYRGTKISRDQLNNLSRQLCVAEFDLGRSRRRRGISAAISMGVTSPSPTARSSRQVTGIWRCSSRSTAALIVRNLGVSANFSNGRWDIGNSNLNAAGGIAIAVSNGTITNYFRDHQQFNTNTQNGPNNCGCSLEDGANIGGIAAFNNGTISNSFANGQIGGGTNTGGLVGINEGMITNSSSNVFVFNESTAAPGGDSGDQVFIRSIAGGLVGLNESTGQIVNSFATNLVYSTGTAGGLAAGSMATSRQGLSPRDRPKAMAMSAASSGRITARSPNLSRRGVRVRPATAPQAGSTGPIPQWKKMRPRLWLRAALVGYNDGLITQSYSFAAEHPA